MGRATGLALPVLLVAGLVPALSSASSPDSSRQAAAVPSYSLWSSATKPRVPADPERAAVTLGVRFRAAVPGRVTAIRFYKSVHNKGPFTGKVWSPTGRALATVTFRSPTSSGWQTAMLSSPVVIQPGRTYTASYRAPHGRYAADSRSLSPRRPKVTRDLRATRGVFTYGDGVPDRVWENANYYVDVRFAPASAVTSPAPSPTSPVNPNTSLDLPRIPWEGGPEYWKQFSRARSWAAPGFFPVGVFYGKPSQAAALHAMGVNTFLGAEHDGSPVRSITGQGEYLIAQDEWTSSELGTDARAVGWLVSDECDMGLGACGGGDQYTGLAVQTKQANALRGRNDGRFLESNFGNGILRTYWSRDVMPQLVRTVDAASADQYAYTSPTVQQNMLGSPDWPAGANPASSAAYGWQADQMMRFQDRNHARPVWTFVEVKRPYLTDAGGRSITPNQLEGAVWSSIIHEARGIMFFQHNNDGSCGNYALVECGTAIRAKVTRVTADIRTLAPVINSQSYRWNFGAAADTMLKTFGGSAYVFAGVGLNERPGSKTFRLPPGVKGKPVTVVGENRKLPVTNGTFTDNFAAEYTHHVYRIPLN